MPFTFRFSITTTEQETAIQVNARARQDKKQTLLYSCNLTDL